MSVEVFDLLPIPLYNADVEAEGTPLAVGEFKAAIADADALLIATPEYNHGVPGVLKNALDWASRRESPLVGKATAIMGASPGMAGAARAQIALRITLASVGAIAVARPQIFVAGARAKFDEDGNLTDDETRSYIAKLLESLADLSESFDHH